MLSAVKIKLAGCGGSDDDDDKDDDSINNNNLIYFNQILNCDGAVLKILIDHKFQWPQGGLNCEPLIHNAFV